MDPIRHPSWREVQRYWQGELKRHPLTCARCGGPIDTGRRRGPYSLDVGHRVGRATAMAQGWPIARINAIENTRPEHARCNRQAGASVGNKTRWNHVHYGNNATSGTW